MRHRHGRNNFKNLHGRGRCRFYFEDGAGDKPGSGPGGQCVCPSCGATASHTTGVPCNSKSCPKCGTTMTRA